MKRVEGMWYIPDIPRDIQDVQIPIVFESVSVSVSSILIWISISTVYYDHDPLWILNPFLIVFCSLTFSVILMIYEIAEISPISPIVDDLYPKRRALEQRDGIWMDVVQHRVRKYTFVQRDDIRKYVSFLSVNAIEIDTDSDDLQSISDDAFCHILWDQDMLEDVQEDVVEVTDCPLPEMNMHLIPNHVDYAPRRALFSDVFCALLSVLVVPHDSSHP